MFLYDISWKKESSEAEGLFRYLERLTAQLELSII